jgi:hypothetical protein
MTKDSLPGWRAKALSNPYLTETQVRVLMHGPESLAEAWILNALRFKYQIRGTD